MSNEFYGGPLSDSLKVSLRKEDLYDRIINLKLVTNLMETGKKEEYVIRSDYEIDYFNQDIQSYLTGKKADLKYRITRCKYKPSIRVEIDMTTKNIQTAIKIYVSNFYLLSKNGEQLMNFNSTKYKLNTVYLQMGYWGQFKSVPHDDAEDLFDFNSHPWFGIDTLALEVFSVTTEKLPPDYEMCITCKLGKSLNGVETKRDVSIGSLPVSVLSKRTAMEDMLFENITRRFVNSQDEQIYDSIDENGQLPVNEAKEHGLQIYVSNGVKDLSTEVANGLLDSDGNEVSVSVSIPVGIDAESTFQSIVSSINSNLRHSTLANGDWIVFLADELSDIESLSAEMEAKREPTALSAGYEHVLPAVNNINIDGVIATIVSPYFFTVEPLGYIRFKNRYATSSQVTYFLNADDFDTYFVTSYHLNFATVDNINEATYTCVKES